MATPLTADQLVNAFKKWHVTFREHTGWRNHNRNSVGAWGPVNGLVLHHTGDDAPDSADLTLLWEGRSDLPGPLCNWTVEDDGTLVLIGNGRANHAGGGDPRVLQAVINESYGDYPPPSRYHEGSPGEADGNTHFYGQETMYSGGHPMTDAAYHTTVLAFAAVCDAHGWHAKSCIGHKEWSNWKSDPGSLDMKVFRADVASALKAGPGNSNHTNPTQKRPEVVKLMGEIRSFLKTPRKKRVGNSLRSALHELSNIERK